MKSKILRQLVFSLTMALIIVSCDKEDEATTCVLQKLGILSPGNHWLLEFNDDGTIASASSVFSGVTSQRYDYSYTSEKISIYLTDLGVTDQLACEIGLDAQGRPVSRTVDGKLYEKLVYDNERLDHSLWSTKDSLVYRYGDSKNPHAVDFYLYNESSQHWMYSHTTTFTYDKNPNPLMGLILPTPDWNVSGFLHENNQTSYSSHGESWYLNYTYNARGYPVSRTLTSSAFDFIETIDFEYTCH